jgi:hypothetical protein
VTEEQELQRATLFAPLVRNDAGERSAISDTSLGRKKKGMEIS